MEPVGNIPPALERRLRRELLGDCCPVAGSSCPRSCPDIDCRPHPRCRHLPPVRNTPVRATWHYPACHRVSTFGLLPKEPSTWAGCSVSLRPAEGAPPSGKRHVRSSRSPFRLPSARSPGPALRFLLRALRVQRSSELPKVVGSSAPS